MLERRPGAVGVRSAAARVRWRRLAAVAASSVAGPGGRRPARRRQRRRLAVRRLVPRRFAAAQPRRLAAGARRARPRLRSGRSRGASPTFVNLGGGFPGTYREQLPHITAYGRAIRTAMHARVPDGIDEVMVEPGRYLVADAGVLRSEVVLVSTARWANARWVYLDCGKFHGLAETMDEAIRYRIRHRTTAAGPAWSRSPVRPATRPTCSTEKIRLRPAVGARRRRSRRRDGDGRLHHDVQLRRVQRLRSAGRALHLSKPRARRGVSELVDRLTRSATSRRDGVRAGGIESLTPFGTKDLKLSRPPVTPRPAGHPT